MAEKRSGSQNSIYHIRVRGTLDAKWADWFPGFVVASRPSGETLLIGAGIDQAALHGVLDRIQRLGLPLLLVVQTTCPCPDVSCRRHGQCQACTTSRTYHGLLPYCFQRETGWDRQCRQLCAAR